MAKLYAELTSDKGGRVASKGGHDFLTLRIYDGNNLVASLDYNRKENQMHINEENGTLEVNLNGFIL
jgi:hypothetical protein